MEQTQDCKTYVLHMDIPLHAKCILEILEQSGFEGFIVGGCVRDSLLGLKPKDWDITTNATPTQVEHIFKSHKTYSIIPIGLKHGTIGIKPKDSEEIFDVTTYRIDGEYKDSRHPSTINFTNNICEDLSRRDFSINAIACKIVDSQNIQNYLDIPLNIKLDSKSETTECIIKKYYNDDLLNNKKETYQVKRYCTCTMKLYDYHNGIRDLIAKNIICVGNAQTRFSEDALRIMRAMRFASILPFGFKLHYDTKQAVIKLFPLLNNISKERINVEFVKLLHGKYVSYVILEYECILLSIMPILNNLDKSQLFLNCVSLQYAPNDTAIRLSILLYSQNYENTESMLQAHIQSCLYELKKLRFDNKTIQDTLKILSCFRYKPTNNSVSIKYFLSKYDKKLLWQVLCMHLSIQYARMKHCGDSTNEIGQTLNCFEIFKNIIKNNECYSLKQLSINGNDIKNISTKLGKTIDGKQIGDILNHILLSIINGHISPIKNEIFQEVMNYVDKLPNK